MQKYIRKLEKLENSSEGVNVEDILKLTSVGDASLIKPLKELSKRLGWHQINNELFVPLATWVDIVCIYFEFGITGVIEVARKKDELSEFALAFLEKMKTFDAFEEVVNLGSIIDFEKTCDKESHFIKKYAYSLNLISFDIKNFEIYEDLYVRLSNLLKRIVNYAENMNDDAMKASAIVCLGNCGRIGDIDFIKKVKPFNAPYAGVEKRAINKIKKN